MWETFSSTLIMKYYDIMINVHHTDTCIRFGLNKPWILIVLTFFNTYHSLSVISIIVKIFSKVWLSFNLELVMRGMRCCMQTKIWDWSALMNVWPVGDLVLYVIRLWKWHLDLIRGWDSTLDVFVITNWLFSYKRLCTTSVRKDLH